MDSLDPSSLRRGFAESKAAPEFPSDHSDHFLVNINKHPCSGGRDGDSHRRHAHAHGRRLARAIPAKGIIIREAFDCEALRCEGLSR